MKSMFTRIGFLALVAVVALGVGACKTPEKPKETPVVTPDGSTAKQPVSSTTKQPEGSATKQPEGSATKQPEGSATKQPEGSTAKSPVTPANANDVPAVQISSEDYWNIQIERLESTKKHYEDILAVYEKYKGDTPEAKQEVRALRQKNQENMRKVFTSHGFTSGRDFFPKGPGRRQVLQERQQYLKANTELWEKYQAMNKEIRELREQVKLNRGGADDRPVRPGPSGKRNPGPKGIAPNTP